MRLQGRVKSVVLENALLSEISRFLNVRLRMLKIELTRAVTGSGSGPLGDQNKASPGFKILGLYTLSART